MTFAAFIGLFPLLLAYLACSLWLNRFWVGGTGTLDAGDTTHIAASSGGAGGATFPGTGDTLTFDNLSGGGTVTASSTAISVTSITWGAFTGTLDFATNNPSVTVSTTSGTGTGTRTFKQGQAWTLTGANGNTWSCSDLTNCTFTTRPAANFTYSGSVGTRTILHGITAGTEANSLDVSVTAGTDIISISTASAIHNLNFTGFSGSWASTNLTSSFWGSLTISPTMTVTAGATTIGFSATSGTQVITSNGVTIERIFTFSAPGATIQLGDNLTLNTGTARTLTISQNTTLDLNGKTLTHTGPLSITAAPIMTAKLVCNGTTNVFSPVSGVTSPTMAVGAEGVQVG